MYGGSVAPSGYLLCDGAAVSRITYSTLFTVLATTYGIGDGTTTFNLPDLRVRVPVGAGASKSLGASDGVAEASRNARWNLSHSHAVSETSLAPAIGVTVNTASAGTPAGTLDSAGGATPTTSTSGAGIPSGSVTLSMAAHDLAVGTASNTGTGGTGARVTTLTGTTTGNHSHNASTASFSGNALGVHSHTVTISAHSHTFTGSALAAHGHSATGSQTAHTHSVSVTSNTIAETPFTVVNYIVKT